MNVMKTESFIRSWID